MKKKLDDITKMKLIYSGELLVFFIIFIVIGVLEVTSVLGINEVVRNIFNFVTVIGFIWIVIDLIWTLKSEKHRKSNSLFDKFSVLPVAIYILVIDIIMFINFGTLEQYIYQLFIGITLLSLGTVYLIQAIYHWFNIHPMILEAIEQDRIDKITYKIIKKNEDGSLIALNVDSNKKFIFSSEANIKENEDELFCLDFYPGVTPVSEYQEENK